MRTSLSSRSLDAVSLLGFGPKSDGAFPQAESGTIVIRYGGWSLQELRDRRSDLMYTQDWYNRYSWSTERLPSGIYVLRLPIPGSNRKTFDEQKPLLLPGEEPAPIVLVATAMLAFHLSGGQDPLKGRWMRCKEQPDDGDHVGLDWHGSRLYVNGYWGDDRRDNVWLASARRLPS